MLAILNSVKRFFKLMFSDSGDVGSKRVVGFEMANLLVIMTIWHLITIQPIQNELIWAVAGLVVGCFSLNAAIAYKQMNVKSDIATEVVKADSPKESGAAAKDVIEPLP